MTLAEFEQEVASATGESRSTIRSRGFSLIEVPENEPLIVDWDAIYPTDSMRTVRAKRSTRRNRAA